MTSPDQASDTDKLRARPTIRDVARHAKVSVGTVSNVLNGVVPVRESRRRAVMLAIEELGFRPNLLAQALSAKRTRVVGLIAHGTSSAYFAALLNGFEEIGAERGYEVMQVLSRSDPELEYRRAQALLARQVDGLILVPSAEPRRTFDLIAEARVPAVVVDRASGDPRFDDVTMDNAGAMRAVVAALADAQCRRVVFAVGSPALVTTRARMAALAQAGKRLGVATETIVRAPDDGAFAAQIAAILRRAVPPDTIVASNSVIALALMEALKGIGARVPTDVSVLVFDEPVWATLTDPPLAIVRHPIAAIARDAWDVLIGRMENGEPAGRRIVHAAEIVMRGSVRGAGTCARLKK